MAPQSYRRSTVLSGLFEIVITIIIVVLGVCPRGSSAYYARNLKLDFLCSPNEGTAYVTHIPWDCASYVICMNGQAIPTPCPAGKLYASATRNSQCETASQVDAARCHRQIWNYISTICFHNPTGVVHDSERCGQYFDCTVTNDNTILNSNTGILSGGSDGAAAAAAVAGTSGGSALSSATSGVPTRAPGGGVGVAGGPAELMEYLLECPYPSLFSTQTGSCQDYGAVSCGEREEPKAPCEYLQYLQLYDCTGPDCLACKRRHPSCVGLRDGRQPVPLRNDVLMECQGERTINILLASRGTSGVV